MLARAGIKPRTGANPTRTALGNISNRSAVPTKQTTKDKEVSLSQFLDCFLPVQSCLIRRRWHRRNLWIATYLSGSLQIYH